MKQVIITLIILSVLFLTATGAWYLSMQKQIRNEAVSQCLSSASVASFSGDVKNSHTFTEPIMGWYKTCMQEKGYK